MIMIFRKKMFHETRIHLHKRVVEPSKFQEEFKRNKNFWKYSYKASRIFDVKFPLKSVSEIFIVEHFEQINQLFTTW